MQAERKALELELSKERQMNQDKEQEVGQLVFSTCFILVIQNASSTVSEQGWMTYRNDLTIINLFILTPTIAQSLTNYKQVR